MPKYYVQSGSVRLVTTASDPRAAAIWAVHRTLAPILPFLSESDESGFTAPPPAALTLGETVQVSEQGFDRPDSERLETLAVLSEWNQLLMAIERIERRLAGR